MTTRNTNPLDIPWPAAILAITILLSLAAVCFHVENQRIEIISLKVENYVLKYNLKQCESSVFGPPAPPTNMTPGVDPG